MMPKNHYLVLGITSDASLDDIKDAYRKLAKEFHPDHYGNNHSPFLAIQEAYSVLSDPVRRRTHDSHVLNRTKKTAARFNERMQPRAKGDIEPLIPDRQPPLDLGTASLARSFHSFRPSFDQLFDRIFSNFRPAPRPKGALRENLTVVIPLTPEQAFHGGHIRVALPAELTCPSCSGNGWIGAYACGRCGGEGILSGEYPVMISYPPGIPDNHTVQMPLDNYGIKNLFLTVHFRISDMR